MPLRTRRWNDPALPDDGQRLLVCRIRPRGVRREDETWDTWVKELAPSKPLLDRFHGKAGAPLDWDHYAALYLEEMADQRYRIAGLGEQLAAGAHLTLLCSSACTDPAHCHRTLLAGLIQEAADEAAARRQGGSPRAPAATSGRGQGQGRGSGPAGR